MFSVKSSAPKFQHPSAKQVYKTFLNLWKIGTALRFLNTSSEYLTKISAYIFQRSSRVTNFITLPYFTMYQLFKIFVTLAIFFPFCQCCSSNDPPASNQRDDNVAGWNHTIDDKFRTKMSRSCCFLSFVFHFSLESSERPPPPPPPYPPPPVVLRAPPPTHPPPGQRTTEI